jgi:hypothetical protein
MVDGDSKGWNVLVWESELSTVLQTVLASSDAAARQTAVDVVHALGARGARNFRALLDQEPRQGD